MDKKINKLKEKAIILRDMLAGYLFDDDHFCWYRKGRANMFVVSKNTTHILNMAKQILEYIEIKLEEEND